MKRQRIECYLRVEGCLLIGDIRTTAWLFKIIWCVSAIDRLDIGPIGGWLVLGIDLMMMILRVGCLVVRVGVGG